MEEFGTTYLYHHGELVQPFERLVVVLLSFFLSILIPVLVIICLTWLWKKFSIIVQNLKEKKNKK